MDKMGVGGEGVGGVEIDGGIIDKLGGVGKGKNKEIEDVVARVLNGGGEEGIMEEIGKGGGGIKLINDGDVGGGINTGFEGRGV
ncbi:fructose-bisphosphatase class II, partial [Bacillus thuringiensis]|uniref:fructose-bisphosphatase class II n=1 Tax=Bacillus thuringiensis TaxID=1428 RepID=UPI0021B50B00